MSCKCLFCFIEHTPQYTACNHDKGLISSTLQR